MTGVEKARENAVRQALRYVGDGSIVGLGSGSTVLLIIRMLAESGFRVRVIPASYQSYLEAVRHRLETTSLHAYPRPDIYLDSFDQVDRLGNMVKGGGGAHLREKILCQASEYTVFIGDYSKKADHLNKPIPLEILPFALPNVLERVRLLGGVPRIRESTGKNGPLISDNGNILADADFGTIQDPQELESRLSQIAGLLASGLFVKSADKIIIGEENGQVTTQTFIRKT